MLTLNDTHTLRPYAEFLCDASVLNGYRKLDDQKPVDAIQTIPLAISQFMIVLETIQTVQKVLESIGKKQMPKKVEYMISASFALTYFVSALSNKNSLLTRVQMKIPDLCLAMISASSFALAHFQKKSAPLVLGFLASFALVQRHLQILSTEQEKIYLKINHAMTFAAAVSIRNYQTMLRIITSIIKLYLPKPR